MFTAPPIGPTTAFTTGLDDAATALGSSPLSANALSDLLAQFTAAFQQTNRLLRLHTPLGANVLLPETFKALEAVSGSAASGTGSATSGTGPGHASLEHLPVTGYLLQIDALSTNAHLELKALIGQPILLELLTDQSRSLLRPFHGHVSAAVCIGSNGGLARYRLTVQPWLAFLGAGRDSAVFQDQSVLQIVQTIFTDYQSSLQGQLAPSAVAWRLDVRDSAAYPVRSLTTQYCESDLQFIDRLLAEEGLFYWFEHTGDATQATLGSHTLVIADHNDAFKPLQRGTKSVSGGASIRFSQSKGVIEDDTIDQWSPQRQWHTSAVEIASWDYRQLSQRPVAEHASTSAEQGTSSTSTSAPAPYVPPGTPQLLSQDTPGAYAYENTAQGQRLARNQLQALAVPGHRLTACGSVRALAPASTFTLSGHASPSLAGTQHSVLRILHHAKNNLSAQLNGHAQLLAKSAVSALDTCSSSYANHSKSNHNNHNNHNNPQIFYRNAALVLPLAVPYRGARTDGHGQLIHPKPSTSGSQTALVIGVAGQHLSTDRDHRVKVQFAWQRGASSQSRLAHPAADGHSGAPAADGTGSASGNGSPSGSANSPSGSSTTGTWVRVATPLAPIAGANWGSVALPRIGQEVLITFLGGDIDRPVITGSLYNGQGADNQQSNQVQQGAANATGNAPSWFPGSQEASGKQGVKLPGHAHNAVLSGIKTQALSTSQSGTGGYNQIVFDDSPGQSRLGLQSHSPQQGGQGGTGSGGQHSGSHELNLGALRQQTDNQRLGTVGYGFELKTHFSGAIRSGSGLLLTADKRQGNDSGSSSAQMDSKEAFGQLQTSQDLLKSLTETAQQHKAMLPVLKTTEVKPDKLPAFTQLQSNSKVIQAKASGSEGEYAAGANASLVPTQTSKIIEDDCKWLEEKAWTVRAAEDFKPYLRPYTLVDTGVTDSLPIKDSVGQFMITEVCFGDGTSELIYLEDSEPVVFMDVTGRRDTYSMEFESYTLEQVADQIASMSQERLMQIERFVMLAKPEISRKGAVTLAYYDFQDNCVVIRPCPKGEASAEKLATDLLHEGGHAMQDRWMGLEDGLLTLGQQLTLGIVRKKHKLNNFETLRQQSQKNSQIIDQYKNPNPSALPTKAGSASELSGKHKTHKKTTLGRILAGLKHKKAWKRAARADQWWVSKYSQSSFFEDFAEHSAAYMMALGTCCEERMRQLMPQRAAILDQYFNQQPNQQSKSDGASAASATSPALDRASSASAEGAGDSVSSGGAGDTIAYSNPLMVLSAPAGIALLTPQSASFNAGQTTSISAGQDINLLAQANAAHMVKAGISLFTYGKASNPKKPNQEVGISLHAASGKVSSQSQSDKTQITADKAITVASTTDAVTIQAPKHVLLTAQGAYIKLSGGNIEVHAPGKVDIKASMKNWTSPKSDSNSLSLAKSKVKGCAKRMQDAAASGAAV